MMTTDSEALLKHVSVIEERCRALRVEAGPAGVHYCSSPPSAARALLAAHDRLAYELGGDSFRIPAIRMLLDLLLAQDQRKRISVSSLCIASGIPATTALRWIGKLTEDGHLLRHESTADRRRAYVDLTPTTAAKLQRVLSNIPLLEEEPLVRSSL